MGKDGGVVKIDLWTSDCSEENDIKLLMPTKIENKKALLTTWTVGEKVNEIMEWQLEEQGIKFEVRKPFCLSISCTLVVTNIYVSITSVFMYNRYIIRRRKLHLVE